MRALHPGDGGALCALQRLGLRGRREAARKSGRTTVQVLRQQFVRLGERRGDYVAVEEGLNEGETLVSTGVFKLRNGQPVVVDNTLQPQVPDRAEARRQLKRNRTSPPLLRRSSTR